MIDSYVHMEMKQYKVYRAHLVWWSCVVPYKNHKIRARTRVSMYLASS